MDKKEKRILESRLSFLKEKVELTDILKEFIPKVFLWTEDYDKENCYQWDCPFCDDSDVSFKAMKDKESYYCFNCRANGDAITFLMCHQKMGFVEAVQFLAKKYDFKLEEEKNNGTN